MSVIPDVDVAYACTVAFRKRLGHQELHELAQSDHPLLAR